MLDPIVVLEVVRDFGGRRDTRWIDRELLFRGQDVTGSIIPDLRELERQGLIEEIPNSGKIGPCWAITPLGLARLREGRPAPG